MSDDIDSMQQQIDELKREVAALKGGIGRRGVRKRSSKQIWGMPLYDIALGPDPDNNEFRGHARGFFAIGDIATGVVAMGGMARGFIAMGGLAMGGITIGGGSIGVLLGIGGLATGLVALGGMAIGVVAMGGGAIGIIAFGGGAFGYYACGGDAFGQYVVSSTKQDPEAVRFFSQWIPGLEQLIRIPRR